MDHHPRLAAPCDLAGAVPPRADRGRVDRRLVPGSVVDHAAHAGPADPGPAVGGARAGRGLGADRVVADLAAGRVSLAAAGGEPMGTLEHPADRGVHRGLRRVVCARSDEPRVRRLRPPAVPRGRIRPSSAQPGVLPRDVPAAGVPERARAGDVQPAPFQRAAGPGCVCAALYPAGREMGPGEGAGHPRRAAAHHAHRGGEPPGPHPLARGHDSVGGEGRRRCPRFRGIARAPRQCAATPRLDRDRELSRAGRGLVQRRVCRRPGRGPADRLLRQAPPGALRRICAAPADPRLADEVRADRR